MVLNSDTAVGYSESRPRQLADRSSPFYKPTPRTGFESRPRQWAGLFKSTLFINNKINSKDLNNPPTTVVGISSS